MRACQPAPTLGIFPEAGHLDERRTRRFRHGSARLILGAMRKAAMQQRGMHVQPVVMDFERYEGYRTHARLRIGAPLELKPVLGQLRRQRWTANRTESPNERSPRPPFGGTDRRDTL